MPTKAKEKYRDAFDSPEFQAMKAARRNLDHNEAVQESAYLTVVFRRQWSSQMAPSPVVLNDVLRTLIEKKIPFVLTGASAIGGWTGRPRSTYDVDILVKGGRNLGRAVKTLRGLYPELEVRVIHGITGFFVPGERESVIDVFPPHRPDLHETLASPVWTVDKQSGLRYRIPSLEAILGNKYGAMLNPTRLPLKRQQDAVDFGLMVTHSTDPGREPIDLKKLQTLGEMVWPCGGGTEILALVEQLKSGKTIELAQLGPGR